MRVAVLGGGSGGSALAFHLVQLGHEVLLYKRNAVIKEAGKLIAVQKNGSVQSAIHGVSSLTKTTSCMKEAVNFSNNIMTVVPAFAQRDLYEKALPHLTKDHTFVSLPGNFAFLDYMDVTHKQMGIKGDASIQDFKETTLPVNAFVELSSIPHACRLLGDDRVFIGGIKKLMHAGVFPSNKTDSVLNSIRPFFKTTLEKNDNVIETGFCNLNMLLHPPTMIYNTGWIESTKGEFLFYKQGLSPSVARLMETMDQERVAVAASIGIPVEDIVKTWRKWYGIEDINTMADIPEKGAPYQFVKAPNSLENRYITEDLTYVLLPIIHYIAKQNNIATPLTDALITSANVIMGRTLEPQRHFYGSLEDYTFI